MRIFGTLLHAFRISRRVSCSSTTQRRYSSSVCTNFLHSPCLLDSQIVQIYGNSRSFGSKSGNSKYINRKIGRSSRRHYDKTKSSESPATSSSLSVQNVSNILPVALINQNSHNASSLKILLIPINLFEGGDEAVEKTLAMLSIIRDNARQIEAFTDNLPNSTFSSKFPNTPNTNNNNNNIDDTTISTSTRNNTNTTNNNNQNAIMDAPILSEFEEPDEFPFWQNPDSFMEQESNEIIALYDGLDQASAAQDLNRIKVHDSFDADSWNDSKKDLYASVPQNLETNLQKVPISSMQLAFEMNMTNVKDALLMASTSSTKNFEGGEFEQQQPQPKTLKEPTLALTTCFETIPSLETKNVPLNFNALIQGTVEIDASKISSDQLVDMKVPEFNDYVTAMAANICSTALKKGFPTDTNRMSFCTQSGVAYRDPKKRNPHVVCVQDGDKNFTFGGLGDHPKSYSTQSGISTGGAKRNPHIVCVREGDKGCISPGLAQNPMFIPTNQSSSTKAGSSTDQSGSKQTVSKQDKSCEPSSDGDGGFMSTSAIIGDVGARGLMSCKAYARALAEAEKRRASRKKMKDLKAARKSSKSKNKCASTEKKAEKPKDICKKEEKKEEKKDVKKEVAKKSEGQKTDGCKQETKKVCKGGEEDKGKTAKKVEPPKNPSKSDSAKKADKPKDPCKSEQKKSPSKSEKKDPCKSDAKKDAAKKADKPKDPCKTDQKKDSPKSEKKDPCKTDAKKDAAKKADKPKDPCKTDQKKGASKSEKKDPCKTDSKKDAAKKADKPKDPCKKDSSQSANRAPCKSDATKDAAKKADKPKDPCKSDTKEKKMDPLKDLCKKESTKKADKPKDPCKSDAKKDAAKKPDPCKSEKKKDDCEPEKKDAKEICKTLKPKDPKSEKKGQCKPNEKKNKQPRNEECEEKKKFICKAEKLAKEAKEAEKKGAKEPEKKPDPCKADQKKDKADACKPAKPKEPAKPPAQAKDQCKPAAKSATPSKTDMKKDDKPKNPCKTEQEKDSSKSEKKDPCKKDPKKDAAKKPDPCKSDQKKSESKPEKKDSKEICKTLKPKDAKTDKKSQCKPNEKKDKQPKNEECEEKKKFVCKAEKDAKEAEKKGAKKPEKKTDPCKADQKKDASKSEKKDACQASKPKEQKPTKPKDPCKSETKRDDSKSKNDACQTAKPSSPSKVDTKKTDNKCVPEASKKSDQCKSDKKKEASKSAGDKCKTTKSKGGARANKKKKVKPLNPCKDDCKKDSKKAKKCQVKKKSPCKVQKPDAKTGASEIVLKDLCKDKKKDVEKPKCSSTSLSKGVPGKKPTTPAKMSTSCTSLSKRVGGGEDKKDKKDKKNPCETAKKPSNSKCDTKSSKPKCASPKSSDEKKGKDAKKDCNAAKKSKSTEDLKKDKCESIKKSKSSSSITKAKDSKSDNKSAKKSSSSCDVKKPKSSGGDKKDPKSDGKSAKKSSSSCDVKKPKSTSGDKKDTKKSSSSCDLKKLTSSSGDKKDTKGDGKSAKKSSSSSDVTKSKSSSGDKKDIKKSSSSGDVKKSKSSSGDKKDSKKSSSSCDVKKSKSSSGDKKDSKTTSTVCEKSDKKAEKKDSKCDNKSGKSSAQKPQLKPCVVKDIKAATDQSKDKSGDKKAKETKPKPASRSSSTSSKKTKSESKSKPKESKGAPAKSSAGVCSSSSKSKPTKPNCPKGKGGNKSDSCKKSFSTLSILPIDKDLFKRRFSTDTFSVLKKCFSSLSVGATRFFSSKKGKGKGKDDHEDKLDPKCRLFDQKIPKKRFTIKSDRVCSNVTEEECPVLQCTRMKTSDKKGMADPKCPRVKTCVGDVPSKDPKDNACLDYNKKENKNLTKKKFSTHTQQSNTTPIHNDNSQKRNLSTRAVTPEAQENIDDCEQCECSKKGKKQPKNEVIKIVDACQIETCPECIPCFSEYDVLIRTDSVALSGSDIHVYETGGKAAPGMTMGHDASGIVEEVGRCVAHLQPGDRVAIESGLSCGICDFCKRGAYNICSHMIHNGFLAKYQVHPADLCHKLPESVSMEDGCLVQILAMGCQACYKAPIKPTSNVLIIGSCATAIASALCARAVGANRICFMCSQENNLEMIRNQYDFDYVSYESDMKITDVVKSVYCYLREWPDVVINCSISETTMNIAVMSLAPNGTCVLAECECECASFNALDVIMKNLKLMPSFRSTNMFPTALQLMECGQAPMHDLVVKTYSWDRVESAFLAALHQSNVGSKKVIVKCGEKERTREPKI